ncbi:hypothetical protein EGW08_009905 [Elysia chlorotica]|uniref:C2H2-type domain-containing protein n=1 Tax=Elysia chlorotica TaxID=188477 RepID=A0A3S0ZNX9_ELYCH|nr:hypothetical protein EGW08_009905 [Elysia chlorotica]
MYYRVIHLYRSKGHFPANSSANFKGKVHRMADAFVLENDTLLYKGRGEKTSLRKVVMTTEERLSKMAEAHIQNEKHVSQFKALDYLNAEKLYWKSMHTDVQAFVTACPGCRFGEAKKRRKSSPKHLRWLKATAPVDEEDSDAEATSDDVSYENLWMYIKKKVTPDTLSRSALLLFRKRAKNFKIEKGILYYFHRSDGKRKPRFVLRTEKEKQEALRKVHSGSGAEHLGEGLMKDKLRQSVFWYGMSCDVKRFIASCTQCRKSEQHIQSAAADKQDTALEDKVKLYQDYFAGKNINPKQECLDSLFPYKESNDDLVATALETAEVMTLNEAVAFSCARQGKPNQEPESPAFSSNFGTAVSQKQKILRTELGKISTMHHTYHQSDNLEEMGDAIDDEMNEPTFQQTTCHVEKMSVSERLEKFPLTVPKLQRIRKRCDHCFEILLGENNYKAHMYKHTGVKPFECDQCHKRFTNIKGLRLHSRKHTGHRPFLCNICGRGFPRSASLRYHIKTHERGNHAPLTCDLCQRTFTTMNRLIKHKGYKHPAQTPVFSCDQCGKRFTAKRSLKRHEETHKGIRKYQCNFCKRRFFRKEYLDYHLVSHANEDPSLLENHKCRSKSKRPVPASLRKKGFTDGLVTVTLNTPPGTELDGNQDAYSQIVEVQVPEGWSQLQREQTLVYELGPDETLVPSNTSQVDGSTTTMVVMETPSLSSALGDAGMEVRHIFLPSQDNALQGQQHHSHHAQTQVSLAQPSNQEDHGHQQQERNGRNTERQPESEIKVSSEIIDSLQQQQQYHTRQQHHHQDSYGPTMIKLTQEDIVSLQQHQQHQLPQSHNHIPTTGHGDSKNIEISLPSGTTHMVTLPSGIVEGQIIPGAGNVSEETIQYQVECLPGETLTEADYNAIRMLAQASLAGGTQHLTQQ